MQVFYGIHNNYRDVTILARKFVYGDYLILPEEASLKSRVFTDHIVGTIKHVKVAFQDGHMITIRGDHACRINLKTQRDELPNADHYLQHVHSSLIFRYGSLSDEYPEQLMAVKYVLPQATVLEIGGNIGRNSLVIASLLSDDRRLVTLESAEMISAHLDENKTLNNFHFHIESAALSLRQLIQKDWVTLPSETLRVGYDRVKTITLVELRNKYKDLHFDTLVADCEGALYYILRDMEELLDGIRVIIVENDYTVLQEYKFVRKIFRHRHFTLISSQNGGWGVCQPAFFQVWIRFDGSFDSDSSVPT